MRVLITGSGGQVGRALVASAPADVEVVALSSSALDITDLPLVRSAVSDVKPDLVLNAAAYTSVDAAEEEGELAFAVNAVGVGNLARCSEEVGARLIQISTDFVFDGASGRPYAPCDRISPLSQYGRSKGAGEKLVGTNSLIVRTAWIYSSGETNFVSAILRLLRRQAELKVVADQIGSPTWSASLSEGLWRLVDRGARGILHFADSGVASRYDFAVAIEEEARAIGLIEQKVPVLPIMSVDYPAPAKRPPFSLLDTSETWRILGYKPPHWRANLRKALQEVALND